MAINYNKVKVAGTWSSIIAQYVKINGVWQDITGIYTKVNGSWKQGYPYPLSKDATLGTITINGTTVAAGGTYNAPAGTTSVTVSATAGYQYATVSGSTGAVAVSYAGNPNTKTITITSQDGTVTANYTYNVSVAQTTSVTIYYKYCSNYTNYSGSYTDTTTTDATTACNSRKAALGNPGSWVCQSGSAPASPNCGSPPCTSCYTLSSVSCSPYGAFGWTVTKTFTDSCCGGAPTTSTYTSGTCPA